LLQDSVALAVEALSWMELEGMSERQALARVSKQLKLHDEGSLRLAFSMIAETNRRLNLIDLVANWAVSPKNLDDWRLGVKSFLRLYVYWTIIRKATFKETMSLLNCGRRILGRDELLPVEEAFGKILGCDPGRLIIDEPESGRVSLETYHQEWFVKYCYRLLGRDDALRLLAQDLKAPPTYLRISRLKGKPDELLSKLESEGVVLRKIEAMKDLWRLERTERPLVKLGSYRLGNFQIQDLSSQAACVAANPRPGDSVLDVCAAPGVKTCSLAQMMENKGSVVSIDISTARMKVWKSEVKRMGVELAQPLISDARQPLPLTGEADVVLLDPPCSNTGLFAKTPSMKWRTRPEDAERLPETQYKMLEVSSNHVRRSGVLVYSTCSLLVEENEMVVEKFLRRHQNFRLTPTSIGLGSEALRGLNEARRLYPHRDGCNGFFLAKLERLD